MQLRYSFLNLCVPGRHCERLSWLFGRSTSPWIIHGLTETRKRSPTSLYTYAVLLLVHVWSYKVTLHALQIQRQYHCRVCLKVYDRRKQLKRTMHLLEPIFSASFLNDQGDIIAALSKKLVVIRADSYQFLTADEMATLLIDYAKSQQLQQPGQPWSQAAVNAQRAATQLAASGSKVHQALLQQATMAQVSHRHQVAPVPLAKSHTMHVWAVCLLRCSIWSSARNLASTTGRKTVFLSANTYQHLAVLFTTGAGHLYFPSSAPALIYKPTIVVSDRLTDTTKPCEVQSSKTP